MGGHGTRRWRTEFFRIAIFLWYVGWQHTYDAQPTNSHWRIFPSSHQEFTIIVFPKNQDSARWYQIRMLAFKQFNDDNASARWHRFTWKYRHEGSWATTSDPYAFMFDLRIDAQQLIVHLADFGNATVITSVNGISHYWSHTLKSLVPGRVLIDGLAALPNWACKSDYSHKRFGKTYCANASQAYLLRRSFKRC